MTVYNNGAIGICNPEFFQNTDSQILGILILIISITLFLVGFAVINLDTLKCGHLVFTKERGIGTAPEIPHQVKLVNLALGRISEVQPFDFRVNIIKHGFTAARYAVTKVNTLEAAVIIERHKGMIHQIVICYAV